MTTSQPRLAFEQTTHSLQAMQTATTIEDLAHAWELFLIYHQRTWNKAEGHYKGQQYWNKLLPKYASERKNDPVLIYVHQARHVDEHGLDSITQIQKASTTVWGGTIMPGSVITGGQVPQLAAGSTVQYRINPATILSKAVVNRQVVFEPPPLNGHAAPPVLDIAIQALQFYQRLFAEIDAAGGD